MKVKDFLTEHDLNIVPINTEDYVLVRVSDEKVISPVFAMREAVVNWITKNTSEIYFKLYNEEI